jgi:hypothetical protein
MNIHTVRDNLKNTIAGKEKMLSECRAKVAFQYHPQRLERGEEMAVYATIDFLKINIDELRRILQDVEQCCEKATQDSWALNPDRSGGQFAQDEIYNMGRDGWIEP